MTVKHIIALMGSVAETLITVAFKQRKIARRGFLKSTQLLHDEGTIDAAIQSELNWLWAARVGIHVFEMDCVEDHTIYGAKDSRRAIKAVRLLLSAFDASFNVQEIIPAEPTPFVAKKKNKIKMTQQAKRWKPAAAKIT